MELHDGPGLLSVRRRRGGPHQGQLRRPRTAHRHPAGLTGFIDVLEADRALLLTEDDCVQSRTQLTLNLVRLYKALGGGWQD